MVVLILKKPFLKEVSLDKIHGGNLEANAIHIASYIGILLVHFMAAELFTDYLPMH